METEASYNLGAERFTISLGKAGIWIELDDLTEYDVIRFVSKVDRALIEYQNARSRQRVGVRPAEYYT